MIHNMHFIINITLSSYYVTPTPSVGLLLLAGHRDPCLAVSSFPRLNPPIYLVGGSITSTQLVTGRGIILMPRLLLLAIGGTVCPVVSASVAVQHYLIPNSPVCSFVTHFVIHYWGTSGCLILALLLLEGSILGLDLLKCCSHGLHLSLHLGGLIVTAELTRCLITGRNETWN